MLLKAFKQIHAYLELSGQVVEILYIVSRLLNSRKSKSFASKFSKLVACSGSLDTIKISKSYLFTLKLRESITFTVIVDSKLCTI